MKKYKFYIGVDISKPFVDFMVSDGKHSRIHAQVANDPESLKAFLTQLRKLEGCRISNCIFGMEHTGIYSNPLLTVLHKLKADVVNENSIQIKNSLGLLKCFISCPDRAYLLFHFNDVCFDRCYTCRTQVQILG